MTVDQRQSVYTVAIPFLLSAILTGGSMVWANQRAQLEDLHKEVESLETKVTRLEGSDQLSAQDRDQIRARLRIVEARQEKVLGILSTLAPKAAQAVFELPEK